MMIAVPRSGWMYTRKIGTAAMSSMPPRRRASTGRRAVARSRWRSARIIASTVNSEGWTWIGPKENQRCEPSALEPSGVFTTSRAKHRQHVGGRGDVLEAPVVDPRHDEHHDGAEHDEERLALEVVVRVEPVVQDQRVARGAVDHEHAEGGDAQR